MATDRRRQTGDRRRRTARYVDPEDAVQKLPTPAEGFASSFMYKHVRDLITKDFSEVRQLLNAELETNTLFNKIWIKARAKFTAQEETLKNQGMEKLPDECHIAIIAYTIEESSLYAHFNQKCRGLVSDAAWRNFPYKSYFALLARAIHGVRNNPDVTTQKYYRGMKHRIRDLKKGDYICPSQFLSCSIDKKVAKAFMGDEADHGTLMKFKGSPLAACGIVNYSDYPWEEEILVFPWSTFKVVKITRGRHEDKVLLESASFYFLRIRLYLEYRDVVLTKGLNTTGYGYVESHIPTLQGEFWRFYDGLGGTYDQNLNHMISSDRYINLDRGKYFDKLVYQKRLALSIDTFLLAANHRAKEENKLAYVHVVGLGLGVWKLSSEQDKLFMDTFAQRLELLSPSVANISDVRFAYIPEKTAGRYKDGDRIDGIRMHMVNRNPQDRLVEDDEGKLLVVAYPWDGNSLPGNEFWGGSLDGSGDPAAACSSQIAELHNWHINSKVRGGNLRVATFKGVMTFREYQELHKYD